MVKLLQGIEVVGEFDTERAKLYNYVETEEISAPGSAPTDYVRFYSGTDGKLWAIDSAGNSLYINIDPIIARVKRSTNLSITNNVLTVVDWDGEDFDGSSLHSIVTNPSRITVAEAGLYEVLVNLSLDYTTGGSGNLQIRLLKNAGVSDVLFSEDISKGTSPFVVQLKTVVSLVASDYLEIDILHQFGAAKDLLAGSFFVVERSQAVTAVDGNQEPRGHDITKLRNVVSHWKCLASDIGTTTLTDALSAHNGTVVSAFTPGGKLWQNSESSQHWLSQKVTLANTANLLTELRDTSCAFMCWVYITAPWTDVTGNAPRLIYLTGATNSETLANNAIFQLLFISNFDLQFGWESGAGDDQLVTPTRIAPGLHHICVAREHETGSGTSTAHTWLDGTYLGGTSGLTNPDGGTTATGYLMVDAATTPADSAQGVVMTDAVLISGSIPTTAEVLYQYRRGIGEW